MCISFNGIITGFSITPANADEREALWEVTQRIQGLLIGDKGYLSQSLQIALARHQLNLQTPLRRNYERSMSVCRRLFFFYETLWNKSPEPLSDRQAGWQALFKDKVKRVSLIAQ